MRYAAKGTAERIPLTTRGDSYCVFEISPLSRERCTVSIVRKPVEKVPVHTLEEYDSPDSLYPDYWEGTDPAAL